MATRWRIKRKLNINDKCHSLWKLSNDFVFLFRLFFQVTYSYKTLIETLLSGDPSNENKRKSTENKKKLHETRSSSTCINKICLLHINRSMEMAWIFVMRCYNMLWVGATDIDGKFYFVCLFVIEWKRTSG